MMLRAMRTVFHEHEHKSCDRDWVPLVVHPFDKHIAAAKLIIHVLLAKRVARQLCGIHGHTLSINSYIERRLTLITTIDKHFVLNCHCYTALSC